MRWEGYIMKTVTQQREKSVAKESEQIPMCSCGQSCKNDENPQRARTEKAFVINEPFRGEQFIANGKLLDTEWEKLEKYISVDERLKFIIIGDLSIKNRYARTFLAVTDRLIYGFDDSFSNGLKIYTYEKVKRAFVKRNYGNAMLVFSMDESESEFVDYSKEHENFLRFSYKVAPLYDAAAFFIQNIAAGKNIEEEMQMIEASFEKQFCICPQCGRNLIRPGAPCMNCQSKDKVVQKLIKYISPYKGLLVISLFLSIITTAVSLLPPYMTKMLVDDVLPVGNRSMLGVCVAVLLGAYFIQYGIGAIRAYLLRVCGDKIVADLRNDVYPVSYTHLRTL